MSSSLDQKLSDVLSEFARTMLTDFPIQKILDHLVERIVEILPITAAGVTLISSDNEPKYIASSDRSALRFEQLQSALGEGPCLAAYQSGAAVSVPDLRNETRFAGFKPYALKEGLRAVFAFPLRQEDICLGALDLYRDTPGGLDDDALACAQTLADVAAAYLINAQARSDLQDSSARARESSLHDALTGLPNRILLLERLERAGLRSGRSGTLSAILFCDLDHFKSVNDLYGHRVGDELLIGVAHRLSRLMRPGDTLVRLAGDEFVLLCEDMFEPEARMIAERIGAAFDHPFALSCGDVIASASVGVTITNGGLWSPEQLLDIADQAMYVAKRQGGGRFHMAETSEDQALDLRNSLQMDLSRAQSDHELHLDYQPIVNLEDGRMTGVEALLRWTHPTKGLITPSTIIPLAEHSGLMADIGSWVLEQACLDRARWGSPLQDDNFEVSINVSAFQLTTKDFAASVEDVLSRTNTDPSLVTLEMTESIFFQDGDRARVVINDLKELGVTIALDDFGAGYSSFSHLAQSPIDVIKIDSSFTTAVGRDRLSNALVAAVIELTHSLNLIGVAEGIETSAQHREIAALGCDSCQGYYIARPMSAKSLDSLLRYRIGNDALHLGPVPGRPIQALVGSDSDD